VYVVALVGFTGTQWLSDGLISATSGSIFTEVAFETL
jgi:hypothetical protein